ncbi:MAG: hypothetical protein EOO99_10235 [Pedobacter sp.]|nr:MAG: hypothetical protein EOO99_10235 [Pedobacter sp.]
MLNTYKYSSILILGLLSQISVAQEVKNEQQQSSEIEVIRPYKPILAEAVKLRRSPDLDNLQAYRAKFDYLLINRKLETNVDIQKLEAQKLAAVKEAELHPYFLRAGIGNLSTLYAEGYFGTGKDEALQSAAYFKHINNSGQLLNQKESISQVSVYGRSIGENSTLNGRINFEKHGLYFYGIDPSQANPNPEKQNFNFIELEGDIVKRFSNAENAWNYAAKANFYLWNDKFDAKENVLTLSAYFNRRFDNLNVGIAANTEIGTSKDLNYSFSNNLLRLNPHLKFQTNGVNITAGINVVQEFGMNSKSRIFPAIHADFELIPDFLQIFAEVKGDVNRNSLKKLTDENPFLNRNIYIQNSVDKLTFSGGIKGTGGPGFGYKAKFYSKQINNFALFQNSVATTHMFDVIYDNGTLKNIGLEGEISVQVSDQLKWTGRVNFDDYKPETESFAYYKPQLSVNSNLLYQITPKIGFQANVVIQDDLKAKQWIGQPDPLTNNIDYQIITLKGFVDLGVGATYKINNKFGAFLNINNVLNTKYSKYLYYNVNGINAFGGISYSF